MRHERANEFALAYRRKHFLAREAGDEKRRPKGARPAGSRPDPRRETRAARAQGLAALLIAAAILAVLNSGGLAEYARDLAEAKAGRPVFAAALRWDRAMDRFGAKRLGESVQRLAAEAQGASWTDVAELIGRIDGSARESKMIAAEPGAPLSTGSLPDGPTEREAVAKPAAP